MPACCSIGHIHFQNVCFVGRRYSYDNRQIKIFGKKQTSYYTGLKLNVLERYENKFLFFIF